MGANMIIKRAISALALTCTATMLMAHAMALPTNSSDSQERIPNGLRRMVQTLKKCDSAINDLAGQNYSFYFGEDL